MVHHGFFGMKSFAQAFLKACQTVDKGARAHTRHFKKSRKHRQTIQNTSIGTASSRADACMLAVFSGSEYPCTPIARRKRHRASFLASLPACRKYFFDKLQPAQGTHPCAGFVFDGCFDDLGTKRPACALSRRFDKKRRVWYSTSEKFWFITDFLRMKR